MKCPKCGGHMSPHYTTIMLCLRCGNKEDSMDDAEAKQDAIKRLFG